MRSLVASDVVRVKAAVWKASFGGDRSAAGRYAAEQRWKNHQKKGRAGGNATTPPTTTPAVRTTEEKLANGPQHFIFGLDQYGMPKMGTLGELEKRYGRDAAARSKYFMDEYGLKVKIVPVQAGSLQEATQLGALQAIEEVLMNTENHDRLVKDISLGDDGTDIYGKFDRNGYFQDGRITLKQESVEGRLRGIIPKWMSNAVDITQNLSFRFAQQGVPAQQDNGFGSLGTMCQRAGYAVMVHEFGHAVDMGGEGSQGRRSDASSARHYEDIFDRGGAGLPKSVSGYGKKNEFEFVGEAWTAWFLFGRSSVRTGFSGESYGELAAPILRPILEDRKDVVKAVERSTDIADLPPEHPIIMFIVAPFIPSALLIKASFGGDRSAAGRYAAQQRWKGHVKKEPKGRRVAGPKFDVTAGKRTAKQKQVEGPQTLLFGRDADGLPKIGSREQLEARYGTKGSQWKRYFKEKYGVTLKVPLEKTLDGGNGLWDRREAALGVLQGLEEVILNLATEGLPSGTQVGYEGRYWGINGVQVPRGLPQVGLTTSGDFQGRFSPAANRIQMNLDEVSRAAFNGLQAAMAESGKAKFMVLDSAGFGDPLRVGELSYQPYGAVPLRQLDEGGGSPLSRFTDPSRGEVGRRVAYATTVHEMAHWLDNRDEKGEQRIQMLGPFRNVRTTMGYWTDVNRETFDKMDPPSQYGASNRAEKFAETFAAWWLYSRAPTITERLDRKQPVAQRYAETISAVLSAKQMETLLKQREENGEISDSFPYDSVVIQFGVWPILHGAMAKARVGARNMTWRDVVRVRTEMVKRSFGGDRSEAGRYAALIRWMRTPRGTPQVVTRSQADEAGSKLGAEQQKAYRRQRVLGWSHEDALAASAKVRERTPAPAPETVTGGIIAHAAEFGGMSVKIDSGEQPTTGFMVARREHSQTVPADEFFDREKGEKALADYLKKNRDAFGPDQYLGLWHDKKSGKVWLDVVDNIADREEATAVGRERNQKAIWDVTAEAEIDTGGTGE